MRAHTGTAGWNVPSAAAGRFAASGSHLERYARRVLGCVEIDSSYHRPHRLSTYERWAASTPPGFRFAVKLPRTITHDARLHGVQALLEAFLGQVAGLGDKLGALLVQLPPSLAFEQRSVAAFFDLLLGALRKGRVVCEPRHASWVRARRGRLPEARARRASRRDPAVIAAAARPGGWLGPADDGAGAIVYYRWHGSPRMYWSRYGERWLLARSEELRAWPRAAECWCVFDNTAAGAAIENALELDALLASSRDTALPYGGRGPGRGAAVERHAGRGREVAVEAGARPLSVRRAPWRRWESSRRSGCP